jgi:thioredoxin/glutathione reductase (selenoprotein)
MKPEEVRALAVDPDDNGAPATFDFDLIVIGGGSGGIAAAKKAADMGKKVALFDYVKESPAGTTWGLGGTCVNVGCIPKKLMHTAALHGETLKHAAPHFGWPEVPHDAQGSWTTLVQNVTMYIKSLNFGYRSELMKRGIKYINSYASFVDRYTIDGTDKKGTATRYTARRFVVATGGRPTMLDIPGKEFTFSSDDIFKLQKEPGRTLVVGASYVALECAGFLNGIGRDVTVMMRSIPLRGFDQQMASLVVENMEKHGTKFIKGAVPSAIEKQPDGKLRVIFEKASDDGVSGSDVFDTVLLAVGRKPETSSIGLAKIGVELTKTGHVMVNAVDRTSVANLYAIGDIVYGGLELTPVAIAAGRYLSERLYGDGTKYMDYKGVPTTVFTPLEYGCVGLSEEAAQEKYGFIEVYHTYFTPLEWSVPHLGDNGCYAKIIVNPLDEERVLGFHIACPNAGEITQGVAVAIKCGARKADFDATIGIHPVIAEVMTDMHVTKSSGADPTKSGC